MFTIDEDFTKPPTPINTDIIIADLKLGILNHLIK